MEERDPELLKSEFLTPLSAAVRATQRRGYTLRSFGSRRDPRIQARYWRQSRSTFEVREGINALIHVGAAFLAELLHDVGPQYGPWRTNCLPGLSWHQWVEACDFFVLEDRKAIWAREHLGYVFFAEECRARNLTQPLPHHDPYHIQLRPNGVLHYFMWSEVDDFMQRWYAEAED